MLIHASQLGRRVVVVVVAAAAGLCLRASVQSQSVFYLPPSMQQQQQQPADIFNRAIAVTQLHAPASILDRLHIRVSSEQTVLTSTST